MASSVIGDLRVNLGLNSAAFQGGMSSASKQMDSFGKVASRLSGVLAGAFSVGALASMADTYTSISNSLRSLGIEQERVNTVIDQLNAIAGRTRAPLEATAQLYQRMAISANELGVNQEQLFRFTENIGLALAQSGGAAGAASDALFQLSQAMGGGVIRAEEFNSIVEGAYPIALAAAKGIDAAGGSVAKLRKLMLDGKLTSKQFFDAIISQTDDLEAAFANTTPTISQAFGRLRDNLTVFVGQLDQTTGTSSTFARMILVLSENIQRAVSYVVGAAGAWATYRAAIILANVANLTFIGTLKLLSRALLATGIGAIVVAAGELVNILVDVIRKAGGFKKAFDFVKSTFVTNVDGMSTAGIAFGTIMDAVASGMETAFLTAIKNILIGVQSMVRSIGQSFSEIPALTIGGKTLLTNDDIPGLSSALDALKNFDISETIDAVGQTATQSLDETKGKIGEAKAAIASLMAPLAGTAGAAEVTEEAITGTGTAIDATGKGAKKLTDFMKKLRDEYTLLKQTQGMTDVQKEAFKNLQEAGVSAASAVGKEITKLTYGIAGLSVIDDITSKLQVLKATWNMSDLQASIWQAQRDAGVTADSAMGKQISDTLTQTDALEKLKDGWKGMGDTAKQALMDIAEKGASGTEIIGNLIDQLGKLFIQAGFSMLAKNAQTSLANTSWGSGLGDVLGNMFPASNANGTNNFAGGWTQIHERGEELAYLPSGSKIIPAGLSKNMMSGANKGAASQHVSVGIDPKNGNVTAYVTNTAGQMDNAYAKASAKAAPGLNADNARRRIR